MILVSDIFLLWSDREKYNAFYAKSVLQFEVIERTSLLPFWREKQIHNEVNNCIIFDALRYLWKI